MPQPNPMMVEPAATVRVVFAVHATIWGHSANVSMILEESTYRSKNGENFARDNGPPSPEDIRGRACNAEAYRRCDGPATHDPSNIGSVTVEIGCNGYENTGDQDEATGNWTDIRQRQ